MWSHCPEARAEHRRASALRTAARFMQMARRDKSSAETTESQSNAVRRPLTMLLAELAARSMTARPAPRPRRTCVLAASVCFRCGGNEMFCRLLRPVRSAGRSLQSSDEPTRCSTCCNRATSASSSSVTPATSTMPSLVASAELRSPLRTSCAQTARLERTSAATPTASGVV
eukprot:1440294-Prymnesium_polylepis.2